MSRSKMLSTPWQRTSGWSRALAVATLAVGAWALSATAGQAHAADVYWSVGVHQPGVSVGVSNAPPVVVGYPSYPVVVHPVPRVIYGPPPAVVIAPQPRVIGWVPPGHRKHWHKHRHYRDDDRWDGRRDRWDDRRDNDRWDRRDDWRR